MAGTLTISTLSDGTNSTSSTNCIQGSAKAWVNFNGTVATPSTIRASYNVSSITKNTTGDYTINLTNALADANYSVVGSGGNTDGSLNAYPAVPVALTTTTARIGVASTGGTGNDRAQVCVAIFR